MGYNTLDFQHVHREGNTNHENCQLPLSDASEKRIGVDPVLMSVWCLCKLPV